MPHLLFRGAKRGITAFLHGDVMHQIYTKEQYDCEKSKRALLYTFTVMN
jgi:hypothetical protein